MGRCKGDKCRYFCLDHGADCYGPDQWDFEKGYTYCYLHGGHHVNVGDEVNFDYKGGCCFFPKREKERKPEAVQLTFDF